MEIARNKFPKYTRIGGVEIDFKELTEGDLTPYNFNDYYLNAISFIRKWVSGQATFTLKTSGSTGVPKVISVTREQLSLSAQATVSFFKLSSTDSSLICLNCQHIAGTMMLARSMISGMNMTISEPSSNPLAPFADYDHFDFTAMVPLQLETVLDKLPEKIGLFNKFKSIIVGGAAVSERLKSKIEKISVPVYATYGMTETLSHIALQKLNGVDQQDYFEALEQVELSLDSRNCLVIKTPVTLNQPVVTNDLVEIIDSKRFRFLGRIDNVINSGGVKIFSEKVEQKIERILTHQSISRCFFVHGVNDSRLGQRLVLFFEGEVFDTSELLSLIKETLDKYEVPKEIRFVKEFVRTATGKVNRGETVGNSGSELSRKERKS